MPVATRNRIAELDHRRSSADLATALEQSHRGAQPGGAALALWQACSDRGLRAWCYEFGFAESLTHAVTVVEIDGVLQVHDAFFNLSYPLGFHDLLDSLRDGNAVNTRREIRDRKIYLLDPAHEPKTTVHWLEANAYRELEPVNGLRRFELLWNPEAFAATCSAIDGVYRDLAARGYPSDLQFLMLHPVSVFDGAKYFRNRIGMPLVGDRDLHSPVAALRMAAERAARDLETARADGAENTATIARLEAELTATNSRLSAALREAERLRGRAAQLAAARDEADRAFAAERELLSRDKARLEATLSENSQRFSAERQTWLQQKVALQAAQGALEAEVAETRSRLSAAADLAAQRDSQVAQLRAEIADTARQFDSERVARVALKSQQQEWEAARLRLESENRDLKMQLEAGSREQDQLRQRAALLESKATALEEHAIEVTHYFAPLVGEIDQLRRDYRSLAEDRLAVSCAKASLEAEVNDLKDRIVEAVARADTLEAEIAASTAARAPSLWRRFFRVLRTRNGAGGNPPEGLEG
jgi:hypothetical protein